MSILTKFNQRLGFTPTEARVVILLVSAFLIGVGIKIVKSFYNTTMEYDYHSQDSTFIALSDTFRSTNSTSINSVPKTEKKNQPVLKVNINKATKEDLVQLPGIGNSIAEKIISYRIKNGNFKTIDDLNKVPGIGKKKLKKIEPLVSTGDKNE